MSDLLVARTVPVEPVRRRTPRDPLLVASVSVIGALVLVALLAPLIAPHDPAQSDILAASEGPSPAHLLGTDSVGRDILSRLIHGARLSLLGPALVVAAATVAGAAIALLCAWHGGRVDAVGSRVLDVVFAFPGLLVAILAVAMFGKGLVAPAVALTIVYVPYVGRIVRSAGRLSERSLPYISALGGAAGNFGQQRICVRHLLPNMRRGDRRRPGCCRVQLRADRSRGDQLPRVRRPEPAQRGLGRKCSRRDRRRSSMGTLEEALSAGAWHRVALIGVGRAVNDTGGGAR